ncbi:GNAT family N-acetyltransferase [Streptomyces agglomeratus]|uniref:GNAT family N-acetyltransferase n=1 Tax=Streptomyces agglomeratus TaxID=285458 RepID=A0A1E5PBW5_9ACTN|nr:GNAT family N-acetyltransferase [Streptomyces agglomeratus]OEJ27030.1 GNAT family N-acetyltransferase [Streptomyces agglomeratus]OEJ38921.1 GNAT family N-acetyltransferase [Streptomyces agglomeratus]OEJ46695.1 GNAT family N-acetyltransferase [Streptomyces agglomeratus]OEJ51449.1 GNAT family N-acetyltransferase [Streptomyces agglomeratus]OEJ58851.1 GNAT family N-acetyltransferase [Streptomyces agglomeratus]
MNPARRANAADAAEVLRLRQVMIDSVHGGDPSTDWHAESLPTVRRKLADPDGNFAAFVVHDPGRPGALAALAAGTVEYRIGRSGNPHGSVGQLFSVATDPAHRRRGHARACVEALLDWFRERGAGSVDLNASAEAEPLYASLGFVRKPDPSMRLTL